MQAQINAQKTDLSTQLSALEAALKSAEANITKAQQTADAATSAAAKAQQAGDTAKQAAEEAKAAAAKAQEAAEKAKKEAIEEAQKLVKDLQAKVDGKVDQSVYDAAIKELGGKIAAIEEGLNKITNSPDANAAAIEQIKIQLKAVEAYKELIDKKADATEITRIDGVIASLKKDMEKLASASDVETIKQQLESAAKTVESINANLVTILRQDLRSLVFMPNLYVDGIEATEYAFGLSTYINGLFAEGEVLENENGRPFLDDDNTRSKILKNQVYAYPGVISTGEDWAVNPVLKVQYHLNPSSAKVTKENLSFISRDVESISRVNNANDSKAQPQIVDATSKDGVLTVSYRAEGEGISIDKNVASVMALQANVKIEDGKKDTTITSDYAMLYASRIQPNNIAYSKKDIQTIGGDCIVGEGTETKDQNSDHIYMRAEDAIRNVPTLSVEYNGSIELKDYLNIHYTQTNSIYGEDVNGHSKSEAVHKVWNYGEEALYDLEYRYSLLEYTNGWNNESDTQTQVHKYGSVTATGHFEPRYVDSEGNSVASDGKSGISSVGKKPIVRVEVVDKTSGKVLLGGFVKIAIVKSVKPIVAKEFSFGKQGTSCNGLSNKNTWASMSHQLLELAAVSSKAEFEQLYELEGSWYDEPNWEGKTENTWATTYVRNEQGEFVRLQDSEEFKYQNFHFGGIYETGNVQGVSNDFIVWETYMNERNNIYAQKDHKVTLYICYKPKDALNASGIAPIYVPVTLEVVKPVATLGKKNVNYWYEENNQTQRLNVLEPTNGKNIEDYTVNLNNAFDDNTIKFTITNNEDGLFNETNWFEKVGNKYVPNVAYKYLFNEKNIGRQYTTEDGATYTLDLAGQIYKVGDHKYARTLVAVDKKGNQYVLATLNDGKANNLENVQYSGTIAPNANSVAKKLLNAWTHDAKTSYYANVGIVAFNAYCPDLILAKEDFKARFLRPIDVESVNDKKFTDASANGSTIKVAESLVFEDWRNVKFEGNEWLFAFYDVKGITINPNNVTTDMNNNDINTKKLSDVTREVYLKFYDKNNNELTAANNYTINFDLSNYNDESKSAAVKKEIKDLFGHITYYNNGNNVKTFKVRIPVTVTYEWGEITTYVKCVVEDTLGNETKK